ncbi:MAG: OmpH family outer membrane protein [Bacteroidota bacterium]|nr:OmpH family outer membrane protein [Bacteroidota bacterium]MDP4206242.1 OmpH family outer membrane protein [Bacteroidota bacterium]
MKNFFKFSIIALFLVFAGNGVFAQKTLKFGHVDSQKLMEVLPGRVDAEKQLEKYAKEFDDQYNGIQKELQQKFQEYMSKKDSMNDATKAAEEAKLNEMNKRLETFQQTATQQVNQKKMELFKPLLEKAKTAIEAVAKEQGLIYVFEVTEGSSPIIYKSPESIDILPMVKKKLGIQ